jgi:hypothetical protein
MRKLTLLCLVVGLLAHVPVALADSTMSYTDTLTSSTDTFTQTITVGTSGSAVDIQTWSFGGGDDWRRNDDWGGE